MLNSVTPAKDYFERNIINREYHAKRRDFIEQKFAKTPKITNSELMAIAKEQKIHPYK